MSPLDPRVIPCGPLAFAVRMIRSLAASKLATTPAEEALICVRTSLRLFAVGSTLKCTPLIEKLPAVTAVAKPALLAVFIVAPTLIPPIFVVLVAV